MNLQTKYLGFTLDSPFMPGASPLTDSFRVGFITVNPKYPNNLPIASDSLSNDTAVAMLEIRYRATPKR